jgi:hypothetical protein
MIDESNLHLTVRKESDEYNVWVITNTQAPAPCKLGVNRQQLYQIHIEVLELLESIVKKGDYPYSINVKNSLDQDLKRIAKLNLFRRIFLGNNPSPESEVCVEAIQEAIEKPSRIQIISDELFLPCNLFYNGDLKNVAKKIDKTCFWGFSHIIEQRPLVRKLWKNGSDFISNQFSCFFNEYINPKSSIEQP